MIYGLIIEYPNSSPHYANLKTWDEVTDYLKNKLDPWVIKVQISKYSSDHRCLGEKTVTMGSLYHVATSPNDSILI